MQKHITLLHKVWMILRPFHIYFYLQLGIIILSQLFVIAIAFLNGSILTAIVNKEWNLVIWLFILFTTIQVIDVLVYYCDQKNRTKHLEQTVFQHLQEYSIRNT